MQDVLKTLRLLSTPQRLIAKGNCMNLIQLVRTYLFTETFQLWNLMNIVMKFMQIKVHLFTLQYICMLHIQ